MSRTGTAMPLGMRFWLKVDKRKHPNGCWEWTGCDGHGYGYFGMYVGDKWKRVKAANVSWELFRNQDWNGISTVPAGQLLRHTCDNPICVRPDHLILGTKADNWHDCIRAGHNYRPHGEDTWDAKLTWEKVREIRNLYASRGGPYRKGRVSERSLATQFGVSRIAIRKVLSHQTWKENYK